MTSLNTITALGAAHREDDTGSQTIVGGPFADETGLSGRVPVVREGRVVNGELQRRTRRESDDRDERSESRDR